MDLANSNRTPAQTFHDYIRMFGMILNRKLQLSIDTREVRLMTWEKTLPIQIGVKLG